MLAKSVSVRTGRGGSIWLLTVAAAIVVAILGWQRLQASSPPPGPGYAVNVGAGLSPRLAPSAAADVALKAIQNAEAAVGRRVAEPRILSVSAVSGGSVPAAFRGPGFSEYPIVWVVTAAGTFTPFAGRAGADPITAMDGYFILDDTGTIVSSGFPLP